MLNLNRLLCLIGLRLPERFGPDLLESTYSQILFGEILFFPSFRTVDALQQKMELTRRISMSSCLSNSGIEDCMQGDCLCRRSAK